VATVIDVATVVPVASVVGMVPMIGVCLRLMIFMIMHIGSKHVGLMRVRGMVLAFMLSLILLLHWESSSSIF